MAVDLAFQPSLYQSLNDDLRCFKTVEQLLNHYREFGYDEGRTCSDVSSREALMATISEADRVLEIGAFATPLTSHLQTADHFDVLDRQQLVARAEGLGFPTHLIPEIRYVDPKGDLEIVPRGIYNVIVSCHVIEHQPCLIRHLNQVFDLLPVGGRYLLVVPDKRYIFDHPLPLTRLSEVIDAYLHRRQRHTLTAVIDEYYASGHNDWVRHWAGDHAHDPKDFSRVREAIAAFEQGDYVDVHAWRFTPRSLAALLNDLIRLEVFNTPFEGRIHPTLRNTHEFFVVLTKGAAPQHS
ncbi:MAG: methyltransferase domain-containing protein [Cyanobacteriota bacterium]|nr:methyltransferase domain-containing protein [Cyanobacteriota bacterium]